VSRFDDDRWTAIDAGELDLDPGDDEFEPLQPPRSIRNVIRDLADYPPTT
jgi:hypothetical protein